jgi:hypothetical protein
MLFRRGVGRTNVAAISACVMMAIAGISGCGGGSSTNPAPTVAVALTPATATVQASQGASFTATVSNDPKNEGTTWTLSGPGCTGAACGSLSGAKAASGAAVMYTAPAAVPNPPTITLTATAVDDSTKSAKATITLTAGSAISLVVAPAMASVATGGTQTFAATLQNDSANKGVNWALSGASCMASACGTVSPAASASGAAVTYTAPGAIPTGTIMLTATSVADGTKSAVAAISLTSSTPPTVSVTPGTANLATGAVTQTFTANVSNDAQNLGVTWSVSGTNCTGAACGSISPTTSASGAAVTYTSAARATSAGTVTVTAASVAEASAFGGAAVTLTAPAPPTIGATKLIAPVAVDAGFGVPAIATDSVGNIDFAWMGFDGIHVTRSTDGGTTFSRDVLVPSDLSLNVQDNLLNMVVDPVGNIDLLWYRDVDGTATNISFLISRSSDNGATFTPPLQFTTNVFPLPQIVGRPDGKLIVTWVDNSSNVVAETTTDGVTLSAPITIASTVPGVAGEQAVVGPNGDVYVLWETGNGTNCSISFSSSGDATTYTAAKTISGGSGTCNSQPSASVDLTGNLDVTWVADTTNLFFTQSVDGGANFSTPINIATPAGPTDAKVIAGADGGIYVLWTASGGTSFASSQNSGASFTTNATPLGVSFNGDPPTFSVDACGNVTVFGGSGHVDSTYQRSNDGGITFEVPVDISGPPHQDFEQQIAMDKSGNVNFAWAIDGPSSVDFARLPTVCHVQ